MYGITNEGEGLMGVIPRSTKLIFDMIRGSPVQNTKYEIKVSFIEIYQEKIQDLLRPGVNKSGEGLKIREKSNKEVYVENMAEQPVSTPEEVLELIAEGERYRHVAHTLTITLTLTLIGRREI